MTSREDGAPLVLPEEGFQGFPRGVRATTIPDPLLGVLLEGIDDLAELKVTLRAFWLAAQRKGPLPAVLLDEFLNDRVLVEGLRGQERSAGDAIRRGLDAAVRRRTLLRFRDGKGVIHYAINTEPNRQAVEAGQPVRAQQEPVGSGLPYEPADRARPNIYALYENNIGTMTPMVAEQLKEAEGEYSQAWIREAFEIAASRNKRSWGYIAAILRSWAEEGREDGKSRRYSPENNRERYIEAYRRRRGHLPGEPGPS